MTHNRAEQLLNSIKSSLSESCCNNSEDKAKASYEYECKRCGLVLEFNKNPITVKCPNDGSVMYRMI